MLSPQRFDDGSVHVWMADLDVLTAHRPELESYLNSTEQARASQFLHPLDRTRFITGRGYLREILSCCTGVFPREINIATTPHGKPFLPEHSQWHFNVAHSRNLALYAISYGREVGIDIERIDRKIPLPPRALCDAEQQQVNQAADPDALFLRFWTLKEAFLKAQGLGLSTPPSHINVSSGQLSLWNAHSEQWLPENEWRVTPLDTFPNCLAAVAACGQTWTVTWHEPLFTT